MTPEQITAGARTVAHLAIYLDELKQSACKLAEAREASRRGYFTPSEDEAVRRLLASYWQSRNALFEVVLSFRDDTELSEEARPEAFLVAYGATVLLVDAARFLREQFEDRPLVRRKLNEPEPHFGIPRGTYDKVQKSLTSTRHAWHLYHAMRYFEEHAAELRAHADDPLLGAVLAVIERLQSRLNVSVSGYAKARLRSRAQRTIGRLRHGLLGQALYGLQKLVSLMASEISTHPGHRPMLPDDVARRLEQMLEPGDVLITRKEFAATNYFLPGYWKHAALYLGDAAALERLGIENHENVRPRWSRILSPDGDQPRRVLESLKDGVWIRSVNSPFSSDAVAVIRPQLSPADVARALVRAFFHEGKPYDFDFDFARSDRLVCTEVVYRAFEGIGGTRFELAPRAGRLTLAAEDLVRMSLGRTYFEPLAAFAPACTLELVSGKEAEALLQKTHDPEA